MKKPGAVRRPLPTSPFKARVQAPLKQFAAGDRVSHDRFGLGRAIRIESDGAVLVDFGSGQVHIAEPFTGLFKL